jgi:PBP1b-binding outer membrane lipoprotein LpoB
MKAVLAACAAVAALVLAGCGSAAPATSKASAPPSTAASPAAPSSAVNYQQQYLADVAPYDVDVSKINPNASSVTDPTIVAVQQASATLARTLLEQSWPASATADVHAMAVAAAKVGTDLSSDALLANLTSDAATADADAQVVRADLGLPGVPASSASPS